MMAAVFIYSLQVAICLGTLYLFYYLALRNLTFYNWNRWFLFGGSIFCFVIPGAASLLWLESHQVQNLPVLKVIPTLYTFYAPALPAGNAGFYAYFLNFWLPLFFFSGMLMQGTRLGIQFWSFYRLRRHAALLCNSSVNLYQIDLNIAPFSFGKSVFLNTNLLQPAELPEVIRHELVHINQKHTYDVLWVEFLILLQWYNPFVYLWKRALRQNLEFIADRSVISHSDTDKKNYQHLLVKVIGLPALTIAQPFNISPLKTRIKMMNKMPSSKRELVKFLFVFPVLAFLALACSKTELLPKPLPVLNEAVTLTKSLPWEFFPKQNPDVETFHLKVESHNLKMEDNTIASVRIKLKSGETEKYNFKNIMELTQFEQKYGKFKLNNLPIAPLRVVKILSIENSPADYQLFVKRHSKVKNIGWTDDGFITIYSRSGRQEDDEVYNLNDPISKALAKKKYGELPKNPFVK